MIEPQKEIDAKAVAPRVTPADIDANIVSEHYFTAGEGVIGAFVAGEFGATAVEPSPPARTLLRLRDRARGDGPSAR